MKTILVAFDGPSSPERRSNSGGNGVKVPSQAGRVSVIQLPEPAISVEIDALLDAGKTHFAEEFAHLETAAAQQGLAFESKWSSATPRSRSFVTPRIFTRI